MAATKTHGKAIASLVCGLIGLGLLIIAGGCGIVSPILGLVAVILGFKARKEIKANPMAFSGDGLALGGIIIGFIALALGALLFLFYVIYFVFIVLIMGGSLFFV